MSCHQEVNASLLAAQLQRYECAATRGHRATGYAEHAGAAKAFQTALGLLLQQAPHALSAAVAVLDEDVDGLTRADQRERLAAQVVQRPAQSIARLGLVAAQQLGHGEFAIPELQGDVAPAPAPGHDGANEV